MSVPRVISHGRCAFIRGFANRRATASFLNLTRIAAPQRQFSSIPRVQKEVVHRPGEGSDVPPTSSTSRHSTNSICIQKIPGHACPADLEGMLRDIGVTVKQLHVRLCRFTFRVEVGAFAELGSDAEVKKAIAALNGKSMDTRTLRVSRMDDTFHWESEFFKPDRRLFIYNAATASQAIQGLLEGRRYRLYVENPGWSNKVEGRTISTARREILLKTLEPFNVEVLGGIAPVWNRDDRSDSTFLTFIEFATKEEAQRAVDALDGTIVEDRRVSLRPHHIDPKRAKQIGRVDEAVLAKVREAGLLANMR